ncbi:MAG: DUF5020 family protein [Paludibacteraceae bacterium]|nr:DUF5020 family protein [Paludibacteraceae bacterium]
MRHIFSRLIVLAALCVGSLGVWAGTNLQLYYDFGSVGTACANQRSQRVTTTLELFYPDPWGNTFAFIDLDYAIHPNDPNNTPFMAYTEIARCLNFWGNTPVKDLSVQVEYNGGLGVYKDALGDLRGYGINHAALVGLNYCLHTADYKNIFNIELLYKYIVDDYNKTANQVPLQFTFVWGCDDFCTLPGLRFSGFFDIWGQRFGSGQSFVMISEPQLWYNVGRWFKCPNLNVGTEIEFSYNFTGGVPGTGFMCNPCVGVKWCFD